MNTPDNHPNTRYEVRPFFSRDNPSSEPAGWDVWEVSKHGSIVVSPCDSKEEADEEAADLQKLVDRATAEKENKA